MKTGRLIRRALLNQLLALSAEVSCCQNTSPCQAFVPDLETNWIWIAPCPVLLAPRFEVAMVTSCTASSRGATKAKKLVPPLLKRWALFAIPLSVMLMEAPGRPLKVQARAATAGWAPADNNANVSALRPGSGRSCRYF